MYAWFERTTPIAKRIPRGKKYFRIVTLFDLAISTIGKRRGRVEYNKRPQSQDTAIWQVVNMVE
jgi:hypothetical protein